MPFAFRSILLEEVGSTNSEAFARAAAGEQGPLWVVARRQSRGRGRSGRSWTSDPDNLYATLLQQLDCPFGIIHQISLLAGIATVDAIRAVAGAHPLPGLRLKWPNDVLIGEAKCAGILSESQHAGQASAMTVAVGIGINLSSHPADIGRPATHLAAHGLSVTPPAMLAALAEQMHAWLAVWDGGLGASRLIAAWLQRAGPLGEAIAVNTGTQRLSGTFLGLDGTGALILREPSGVERCVTFGDVDIGAQAGGTA